MKCNHQFIKTREMERPDTNASRMLYDGIEVACALCGEIRHLEPDGTISISIDGNILKQTG